MSNEENIRELQNMAEYDRVNSVSMKEFNQFKADISKVLFRYSEFEQTVKSYMLNLNDLYFKQEEKIRLLDQERLVLEERIQTLEKTIKLIGDDLTTWIEDSELQVEEATNPEDYERDATIERAEARKEARD